MTAKLTVETPEGVVFSFPLAGAITRFLAWAIDGFTVSAISSMIGKALQVFAVIGADWMVAIVVISYFVISIGYGITLEWRWRGQTIGKRVFRLRVMDAQGCKLQFNQIAIRNLLRFVDGMPGCYLVGGIFCVFTRNSQRLGDLAAGTIVVHQPKSAPPDIAAMLPGKFNSLAAYPHLAARLRQKVNPELVELAQQALLRRNQLDPQSRVEVFQQLAIEFQKLVEFPEEATFRIADEQYVRNALGVMMRIPPGFRH